MNAMHYVGGQQKTLTVKTVPKFHPSALDLFIFASTVISYQDFSPSISTATGLRDQKILFPEGGGNEREL